MTRDEALKLAQAKWPTSTYLGNGYSASANNQMAGLGAQTKIPIQMTPEVFVHLSVALGMLKLDEPKKAAEDKVRDIYFECAHGDKNSRYFINELEAAGLKIVEK